MNETGVWAALMALGGGLVLGVLTVLLRGRVRPSRQVTTAREEVAAARRQALQADGDAEAEKRTADAERVVTAARKREGIEDDDTQLDAVADSLFKNRPPRA